MTVKNDFVLFAGGNQANTFDPTSYAANPTRQQGVTAGTASSKLANTTWRQTSMIGAMIGMFININAGTDALDNGNVGELEANFELALRGLGTPANDQVKGAILASKLAYSSADKSQLAGAISRGLWAGPLGGTGDLATATLGFTLTSLPVGSRLRGQATATNTTTTPKLRVVNLGGDGVYQDFPILKADGSSMVVGDIKNGRIYSFDIDSLGNALISGGGLSTGVPSNVIQYVLNPTLIVRPDGNDANDGSANDSAHAFQTIAAAIQYGLSRFSLAGGTLTIKLGTTGTYAAPGVIPATVGTLLILGDTANPGGYTLNGANNVSPVFAQGVVNVTGVSLVNNAVGFATATASANGFLTLTGVQLSTTVTASAHIAAGNTGIININAGCTILTGASNCLAATTSGSVQLNAPLALAGTPGFPGAFALASVNGSIGVASGVTFPGTGASGIRYIVTLNGTINTSGGGVNFFPGNQPGVNQDGTGAYA